MATRPARRTLSLEQSYYVRLAEKYRFFSLSLHFLRSPVEHQFSNPGRTSPQTLVGKGAGGLGF
ncbi:MAG: hypothetical protein V7K14_07770 [Nostoc sp.]